MKTIMGYSDKISACPGETIKFMVSCEGQPSYRARLVRIIHGDTSPEGPGYKESEVASAFHGEHKARKQEIHSAHTPSCTPTAISTRSAASRCRPWCGPRRWRKAGRPSSR